MRNVYKVGAALLFVLHLALGLFTLTAWHVVEIRLAYLILLTTWLFSWIFLGYCPLTKWEFMLHRKLESDVDTDTEFIQHYAFSLFGIKIPSRIIFGTGIVTFGILLYLNVSYAWIQ